MGEIKLTIDQIDNSLRMSIVNDLAREQLGDVRSHKVGIQNVRQRLENLYENQHQFHVNRDEDGRFAVTIVVPYRTGLMVQAA